MKTSARNELNLVKKYEKFGSAPHLGKSFIITNRKKTIWICPQAAENANTTQGTIFI